MLSRLSRFNDCLRFSKTQPEALKIGSDLAEFAETTNKDFANKESWEKVKECLFYHSKIVSSFENEIFVKM